MGERLIDVRTVLLPSLLKAGDVENRVVVVFDVLRATTTISTAIAHQAREVRVFDSLEAVQAAATAYAGPRILAGEHLCVAPSGFDLGNSPGDFSTACVAEKTVFLATTNGTRALYAARKARILLTGALVNAYATAILLHHAEVKDVTLLCSGTGGEVSMEDLLGAGAVIDHLEKLQFGRLTLAEDVSRLALSAFRQESTDLRAALERSQGGINLARVQLYKDIHDCSRLDTLHAVAECDPATMALTLSPRL